MKRWLKTDLHTHTADDPLDGGRVVFHSAHELIEAAADGGFEVLSITNHNQQFFNRALRLYARERGILLIPGVEVTLQGKHVLLYNFKDYRPGWSLPETIRLRKGLDQLVVAPHPFFPIPTALRRHFFQWVELFDALEYSHFYLRRVNFNRRALRVAQGYRLPMIGNSDLHRLDQLGLTFSLVYAEKKTESVLAAIKRGRVRVVSRPQRARFFVNWLAVSTHNRSKHALRALFQARGRAGAVHRR